MDPLPLPATERLAAALESLSDAGDPRGAYRRQLIGLARRAKLLAPLADELADRIAPLPPAGEAVIAGLATALEEVLQVLTIGCVMSRIALVLESDNFRKRFEDAVGHLDKCLTSLDFDELEISDEVREQVELVHNQLKRSKDLVEMPDDELRTDVLLLYNKSSQSEVDTAIIERLSDKLQLTTISDLMCESLALHEMVASSGGKDPGEHFEKMSMLLKKIKDYVQTMDPEMGTVTMSKFLIAGNKQIAITVPEEFRCPISLELMKDPVIVASGQTYERECIMKWLASGNNTCPTTRQKLSDLTLTPNYVLRSLIAQWCEANGIPPPERSSNHNNAILSGPSSERGNITTLISKLRSRNLDDQRAAAGELRLLAKRNTENRIIIAEAGAIPLLVNLLSSADERVQEHAVTALLNLSIYEDNKVAIMFSGAVTGIVHVLRNGSSEARENAAATIFSLSLVREYKVILGAAGAIPLLISLLCEGSPRGKKDAATAIFNLCIYHGNKVRAIRGGIVPILLGCLTDPAGTLIDEALAILSVLTSHPEGKLAVSSMEAMPMLVDKIRDGTPRIKENASAVILNLCSGELQSQNLTEAEKCSIMEPLRELVINGTERGKRKASQLLDRMSRFLVEQQEQQHGGGETAQAEAPSDRVEP